MLTFKALKSQADCNLFVGIIVKRTLFIKCGNFILVGLYYCFKKMTDTSTFIVIYGVLSLYFSVSIALSIYLLSFR